MAIREIKIQFNSSNSPSVPAGWIDGGLGNSTGLKASDMDGTGIDFSIVAAFSGEAFNNAIANQEHYGIPSSVWTRYWTRGSVTPAQFALDNFLPGQPVEIDFFGVGFNAGRHRLMALNGGTQYTNIEPGGTAPLTPNPPTIAYGIADGNGTILADCISADNTTLWQGIIVRFDDAWSPEPTDPTLISVDEDNSVEYGQSCTYEAVNFSDITSITIAGIAAGDITNNSFTAPSLIDENTVPMLGEQTITISDGEDSDSITISVFPPDGFNSVILGEELNTSDTGVIHEFIPAAKAGDGIIFPPEISISPQGNVIGHAGVYECWHLSVDENDPNVAVARSFTVTLGGGGSDTGFTVRGFTVRGF